MAAREDGERGKEDPGQGEEGSRLDQNYPQESLHSSEVGGGPCWEECYRKRRKEFLERHQEEEELVDNECFAEREGVAGIGRGTVEPEVEMAPYSRIEVGRGELRDFAFVNFCVCQRTFEVIDVDGEIREPLFILELSCKQSARLESLIISIAKKVKGSEFIY